MIKYHAFVKVIELKSITKAAEALGYSQPGLSHILKSFEEELGFPLLIKQNKTIVPTENGERILPYCRQLIDVEQKLMLEAEHIETQLSGSIRIGTPNSMLIGFVSYLINYFTKKYEGTNLTITEDTLENVATKLNEGSIDVAFLTEAISGPFKFFPLFKDQICVAVHKTNPLAEYAVIPTECLETVPIIGNAQGWDDISQIVLKQLPFKPNIKAYTASDFAALAMVANNSGVYIVSSLQKKILPRDVVMRRLDEQFSRTVGMAVKSMKSLTSIQKEFIQVSQKTFSDELKIPSEANSQ